MFDTFCSASGRSDSVNGLSRWEYHFAFWTVVGKPPPRADVVELFGEEVVAQQRYMAHPIAAACPSSVVERGECPNDGTPDPSRVARDLFVQHVANAALLDDTEKPLHRAAFDVFDSQLKGFVTPADFYAAAKRALPEIEPEVAARIYRELNPRGDGRLLFQDVDSYFEGRGYRHLI